MNSVCTIYRLFDDNEEKHYVSSVLQHQELEKLAEEFKVNKKQVVAKDFIDFVQAHDKEATEVQVKDLYF